MKSYRVLRDVHIGALRKDFRAGDTLQVDARGTHALSRGAWTPVPGLSDLVRVGILAPTAEETSLVLSKGPPEPLAKGSEVMTYQGESFKTTPTPPAALNPDKPHVWGGADLFGRGERACRVCGVTCGSLNNPAAGDIQTDRPSFKYRYTDAYGVSIETMTELPCPVFVGQLGGAVAGTTHRVRKLTGKVEGIDERVTRLEEENQDLRVQASRRQEVALDLLSRLVSAAERLATLGDTEVTPSLLVDRGQIIDVLSSPVPERELVPVSEDSSDLQE